MLNREPDVVLTDYALVVECLLFAFWIYRSRNSNVLRFWFGLLFGSIGAAALVGGTVHGFLTDPQSAANRLCWLGTMLLLGVTAFSEYGIAARLLLTRRLGNVVIFGAALIFVVYVGIVVRNAEFRIAVLNYLSGLAVLLVAFVWVYVRNKNRGALAGVAGLLLTIGASAVQQARISLHPRYLNYNAFYHLLEGIALLLIYRAARSLVNVPLRRNVFAAGCEVVTNGSDHSSDEPAEGGRNHVSKANV